MVVGRLLIVMLCSTLLLSCNKQTPKAGNTSGDWNRYVEQFIEDYFRSHPDTAVNAGRHEYDGKLPDWSPEGIRKEIARLKQERGADNSAAARAIVRCARATFCLSTVRTCSISTSPA